jgi:hypothetical protein
VGKTGLALHTIPSPKEEPYTEGSKKEFEEKG